MTFKRRRHDAQKSGWRRDRIRQLIGIDSVNFSVVRKLIFACLPGNICVSVNESVNSCRLSIYLHRSIAKYHKRSSAVNVPAPHEYERGSLENELQANTIR